MTSNQKRKTSRLDRVLTSVIVIAATACAFTAKEADAFKYIWKRVNGTNVTVQQEGRTFLRMTRNSCSIGDFSLTGEVPPVTTYFLGLDAWNRITDAGDLFTPGFVSEPGDCTVKTKDGINEVGLVRTDDIDGNIGLTKLKRKLIGGRYFIVEADVLVATVRVRRDGTTQSMEFTVGQSTQVPTPFFDRMRTYLHEVGHAIGLSHDNRYPNIVRSPARIVPRVGDTRQSLCSGNNVENCAPFFHTVLPDERRAAREEYQRKGTGVSGNQLFASAQYSPLHLGMRFMNALNDAGVELRTVANGFLTVNWATQLGSGAPSFAEIFMNEFNPDNELDGSTINVCPGDYIVLPYSIGNGTFANFFDLCHGFFVEDSGAGTFPNLLGVTGRATSCGLRVRQSPSEGNLADGDPLGGFVTGILQVHISDIANAGTFRVQYDADPFFASNGVEFDDRVDTGIRIRVQTNAENPRCPVDPLMVPMDNFCLEALVPHACNTDMDCIGFGNEVEQQYLRQVGVLAEFQVEDYDCLPAADSTGAYVNTCVCPENPAIFVP